MEQEQKIKPVHKHLWRQANMRLVPSAVLAVVGAVVSDANGNVRFGTADHKIIALLGVLLFIVSATTFLRILTSTLARLLASHPRRRLNAGRAAAIQFMLRAIGYTAIVLSTLELVGIPVGNLVLGGAALGIILGVAAQQALANFFASIVLIVSHPFSVGQDITFNSGALGGKYSGKIKDIGLTHTRLQEADGNIVLLPNATLLSGATVSVNKEPTK